jgi:hypothetical protein
MRTLTRMGAIGALLVSASVLPASAQEPKATTEIKVEYLMTLEAPLSPPQVIGTRRVVNVPAGGSVRGPRIKGEIIAPAGDWLTVMPDGSARLDVRLTIKTDDNDLIFVEYGGVMVVPKEAAEKIGKGEMITHADAYVITAPRFTTASTKYAWLNHVQAVGKMVSLQRGRGVKYDIFEVK